MFDICQKSSYNSVVNQHKGKEKAGLFSNISQQRACPWAERRVGNENSTLSLWSRPVEIVVDGNANRAA